MKDSARLGNRFAQLRELFSLMGKQKYKYIVLVILNQMTTLIGSLGVGVSFNMLINGLLERRADVLWQCMAAILALFVCLMFVFPQLSFRTSMLAKDILYQLRRDMYQKILNMNYLAVSGEARQSLYTCITNDVEVTAAFFAQIFQDIVYCLVYFIGTFLIMVYLNPLIALTILLSSIMIFFVNNRYGKMLDDANRMIKERNEEITETYHQTQSAIRTVKIYQLESKVVTQFAKIVEQLMEARRNQVKLQNRQGFLNGILTDLCGWGSYLIGGVFAALGMMNLGNVVLFAQAQNGVMNLFNSMPTLLGGISDAYISHERIIRNISLSKEEDENVGERLSPVDGQAAIQVENLTFAYDKGHPVLNGAKIVIEPQSVNCIIARNGAGKSTFIRLLTRLLEPDEGYIQVMGSEIANCRKADLRKIVYYVEQNPYLFSLSIRDNFCMGLGRSDITDEEMRHAAELACIHDRIAEMPEQYEAVLNRTALAFSKGEQQRLALARMFLAPADIIILDESMSAIDAETAEQIMGNIRKLKDKTIIYICHDVRMMPTADRVYYLQNGQFVELADEVIQNDEFLSKFYELHHAN